MTAYQKEWDLHIQRDELFSNFKNWNEVLPYMQNLDDEGFLKKHVIKEGYLTKGQVPEDSIVRVHYTVQVNGMKAYVDNTLDRGKPDNINLRERSMIPGLYVGLLTMRKKEISVFYMIICLLMVIWAVHQESPLKLKLSFTWKLWIFLSMEQLTHI